MDQNGLYRSLFQLWLAYGHGEAAKPSWAAFFGTGICEERSARDQRLLQYEADLRDSKLDKSEVLLV